MKHIKYAIILACLFAGIALVANAVSIRSLLGLDDDEDKTEEVSPIKEDSSPQPSTNTNWAKSGASTSATELNLALVKRLLTNIEAAKRTALIADEAAFSQFIKQEANNLSVISGARANKLETDVNTAFLMQRGAENILREVYLNKLILDKLPADFPTKQQVQEYFDKNQDKFVIEKRVHVWQIFFPTSDGMKEKEVKALKKKANDVAALIRKKKISFNDAATKYSKHVPSNANGGYMGLIKTAVLKPDLQKIILDLTEGKISRALTTDTGIHIVKRGVIAPERKVTLEEGRVQIRKLLNTQVRAQLRKAIFEQAAKSYPVVITDNKIEEWRLRLKTNIDAPAAK